MKVRTFLLVLLLVGIAVAAAKSSSDLSGTWKFVPEKSAGGHTFPPDTSLVVKEYGARIYFEYWANNHVFRRESYRTDGNAEKGYATANERVTVQGKIRKNELILTTNHIMENEIGSQSFSETDRWIVSDNGKVLTCKPSDNKTLVFEREDGKSAAAPAASSSSNPATK